MIWAKIALAALAIGALIWWHQRQVDNAYSSGQTAERLVWSEKEALAVAKADADRVKAQAKITEIEKDYWQRQAGNAGKISELEKALADEKNAPVDSGNCPPAVSKRVRDKLDAIGR